MIQGPAGWPGHGGDEGGVDVAEWFGVALDHEIVEFSDFRLVR